MEIITSGVQVIQPNEDVLFSNVSVPGSSSIVWRQGSGIVTLRGLWNGQSRARFKIDFGANIAIPEDAEDIAPLILAFSVNGEPILVSRVISSPADTLAYNNVFRELYLDVPTGCCTQLAVKNIGTIPISLQDGILNPERVA